MYFDLEGVKNQCATKTRGFSFRYDGVRDGEETWDFYLIHENSSKTSTCPGVEMFANLDNGGVDWGINRAGRDSKIDHFDEKQKCVYFASLWKSLLDFLLGKNRNETLT